MMSSKITASTVHGKGAGRPLSGSMTDMRWPSNTPDKGWVPNECRAEWGVDGGGKKKEE